MSEGIKSIPSRSLPRIRDYSSDNENNLLRSLRRINWPLLIGGLITLLIFLMAIKGQDWALKDPMQENYALKIDGKIVRPPYPPFTLPSYPLGTDQFGRDLLSRMLWGVRPTLILVGVVAAIRLIMGLFLGVFIGWSVGMRGRILDTILSAAIAIPVLIVALIGITAVGIQKGLSAFIFGLVLTGWAETARIISSQTRIIKGQAYIEAAQALGASETRIFRKHVLHQISPLVWMLLAFEISATLMVVSELGFLGYYIGGGIWIEISDFVAVNTTGLPELGQMLSSALVTLTKPLVLIIVGSFIFLTILGFNLLGEGLRLRLSRQMVVGRSRSWIIGGRFGEWWEGTFSPRATDWLDRNTVRLGLAGALILVIGGWTIWNGTRPIKKPVAEQEYLVVPGGHLWAGEWHDAQGTRWIRASGPKTADILWTFQADNQFVGGPVVAADGTLYIATAGNQLLAINPEGQEIWRAEMEGLPVGSPALGPGGEVYVSDTGGGLSAYSPDGQSLWRYVPEGGREGTSGPVVDSKGNIYYTRVDSVQALSPDGTPLWFVTAFDGYAEEPPILSAGEGYVFLVNGAISAESGAPLNLGQLTGEEIKLTTPAFFVGADGKTYIRTGHGVMGWVATKEGVKTNPPISWNNAGTTEMPPISQGTTPEQLVWLFYSSDYNDTRLVWMDKSSRVLSNIRLPDRQSDLIGIDQNSTAYICSNNFTMGVDCKAIQLGEEDPVWELKLGDYLQVKGGALVQGRMYISTDAGTLYAVGNPQGPTTPASQVSTPSAEKTLTQTATASIPETSTPPSSQQPTQTSQPSIFIPGILQAEEMKLFLPIIYR